MININFDNPYYLFIAIPLFAFVLVSFFITFRKSNTDKHVVISLVLHLLMVICITFAVAGTSTTAVLTQTQVYVVADVSFSSERNLDAVDAHIRKIEEDLPSNMDLGIVCFGRDYTLLCEAGDKVKSVKTAQVDGSETDIFGALHYTATLFDSDAIKRIVLITDGKQTGVTEQSELYDVIEAFKQQRIYIDAVYMDATLPDSAVEVQISEVDYVSSAYVGKGDEAYVYLQANGEMQAFVDLYKNGELEQTKAVQLYKGENDVQFALDTTLPGTYDYQVVVRADGDELAVNNEKHFTQTVAESKKVLLLTSLNTDVTTAKNTYGAGVELTSYVVNTAKPHTLNVPTTLEQLCGYDEIVLSNVDVRSFVDSMQFVENLNTVVSVYGKSLVTFGDLQLQNKTDDLQTLGKLEDMLPIKFGASEADPTLYGIVIDASHSMNQGRWPWVVSTVEFLINQMREEDGFAITYFDATGYTLATAQYATENNKTKVLADLKKLQTGHGTYIASGLNRMRAEMAGAPSDFIKKQVILISDGRDMAGASAELTAPGVATELRLAGARVSALNIGLNGGDAKCLRNIVSAGGGAYFEAFTESQLANVLENSVTDNLMGQVIQADTPVRIQNASDDVLEGVGALANVQGYICGRALPGAIVVLYVEHTVADSNIPVEVPLYAYKDCGNGRVSTFTSSLSGRWTQKFLDAEGKKFFGNVIQTNTPEMRVDYPFTLNLTTGDDTQVEVIPSVLSRETSVSVTLTLPNGQTVEQTLRFEGNRHYGCLTTGEVGLYSALITYRNNGVDYTTVKNFYMDCKEEYDAFVGYDAGLLYELVDERGNVFLDGDLKIENNPDEVSTYTLHLTLPLMIACVILYVVDIMVRKLEWKDIKGLFVRINKGGKV